MRKTVEISTISLVLVNEKWLEVLKGHGFTDITVIIPPYSPRSLYQTSMPDNISQTLKERRKNPYSIIDASSIEEVVYEREGQVLFTEVIFKKGEATVERIVFFHPA